MNRKRKTFQNLKIIRRYGVITEEYKRPPEPYYPKGSYFANFQSEKLSLNCCCGDVDKYNVYKEIVKTIKEIERKNITNE